MRIHRPSVATQLLALPAILPNLLRPFALYICGMRQRQWTQFALVERVVFNEIRPAYSFSSIADAQLPVVARTEDEPATESLRRLLCAVQRALLMTQEGVVGLVSDRANLTGGGGLGSFPIEQT